MVCIHFIPTRTDVTRRRYSKHAPYPGDGENGSVAARTTPDPSSIFLTAGASAAVQNVLQTLIAHDNVGVCGISHPDHDPNSTVSAPYRVNLVVLRACCAVISR
jgi:hypothetical protein